MNYPSLVWRQCVCERWYWGAPQSDEDAKAIRSEVDVMTLRRALERGLAAVDDEWTVEELAELTAVEYAALASEQTP